MVAVLILAASCNLHGASVLSMLSDGAHVVLKLVLHRTVPPFLSCDPKHNSADWNPANDLQAMARVSDSRSQHSSAGCMQQHC